MFQMCSKLQHIVTSWFFYDGGKRPLGRPKRRWEDVIKVDLREIGRGGVVDSAGSEQGPVAAGCGQGDEPSGSCAAEFKRFQIN
jgi:hypothetical protein